MSASRAAAVVRAALARTRIILQDRSGSHGAFSVPWACRCPGPRKNPQHKKHAVPTRCQAALGKARSIFLTASGKSTIGGSHGQRLLDRGFLRREKSPRTERTLSVATAFVDDPHQFVDDPHQIVPGGPRVGKDSINLAGDERSPRVAHTLLLMYAG
jgi:hypothetical protein